MTEFLIRLYFNKLEFHYGIKLSIKYNNNRIQRESIWAGCVVNSFTGGLRVE